ncbi:MAG: hypothetical protein KIT83_11210 [Bryobacterales bacterium]|nr:hypothetical protein [Bryobacterales bacterium]
MRPYLTAKFLRVGNHLVNLELIQQLEVRKDDSAVITVPGPRKSFRMIEVPAPAGRQLWEFFSENLVVIDFEPKEDESAKSKHKPGGKTKEPKAGLAKKPQPKPKPALEKKSQPKKKAGPKKPQPKVEATQPT